MFVQNSVFKMLSIKCELFLTHYIYSKYCKEQLVLRGKKSYIPMPGDFSNNDYCFLFLLVDLYLETSQTSP